MLNQHDPIQHPALSDAARDACLRRMLTALDDLIPALVSDAHAPITLDDNPSRHVIVRLSVTAEGDLPQDDLEHTIKVIKRRATGRLASLFPQLDHEQGGLDSAETGEFSNRAEALPNDWTTPTGGTITIAASIEVLGPTPESAPAEAADASDA